MPYLHPDAFPLLAEFANGTYVRTRRGRREVVRKRPKTVSLAGRLLGPNRAKYTDPERNMAIARKMARQQKPNHLLGPNRAKYTDPEYNKGLALEAARHGSPGLLERFGIIPRRR